ncbi:MAG: hypothetical protein E6G00_09490 [Actinobacteria bacterium]|nr:MAG: hypothetical protein E6G29_02545 [Actinomycetota bacterium]TMM09666.1 MAG: hypothetical protein E6G00_09490 [Actinomycetota bacterium]
MAVPRPVMLAILGLALIAGAFLVTRSGSNQSVTQASKPAPQTPVSTPPQPATKPGLQLRHTPVKPLQSTRALSRKPVAKPVVHPRVGADGEIPPQAEAAATALEQGKVVVLFFTRPGSADDAATASSVKSVRGMKGVSVFSANLAQIAAYRQMLAGVGISEVPAVVVVRPGRRAVLFQGYVDSETLHQNVADALR